MFLNNITFALLTPTLLGFLLLSWVLLLSLISFSIPSPYTSFRAIIYTVLFLYNCIESILYTFALYFPCHCELDISIWRSLRHLNLNMPQIELIASLLLNSVLVLLFPFPVTSTIVHPVSQSINLDYMFSLHHYSHRVNY